MDFLQEVAAGLQKTIAPDEWLRCKADIVYFIENYCYIFDPNSNPSIFLFKLWPHQLDAIKESLTFEYKNSLKVKVANAKQKENPKLKLKRYIEVRVPTQVYVEDVMWEKTRQMGMSWLGMAIELYIVVFFPGVSILNQNRKEKKVDDGGEFATPDSLHGKIKFIYDRLPEWVTTMAPIRFKFLSISNQANASFITGESANPNSGRGGTYKMVFQDEDAHIPASELVFRAVRSGCKRGVVKCSTPNGKGNCFARLRFSQTTNFKKLRYHWTDHPLFSKDLTLIHGVPTSPWYEKQCADMTDEDVAQELDISYERSTSNKTFPEFYHNTHVLPLGKHHKYDPSIPLHLDFDFGVSDPTSVGFAQVVNNRLIYIDEYEAQGVVSDHIKRLKLKLINMGYSDSYQELICHGDPAGSNTDPITGASVILEYAKEGFLIESKISGVTTGISLMKRKLKKVEILINSNCTHTIDCFDNSHWPMDRYGNPKPGATKYTHDWTSHRLDGIRYKLVNLFPDDDESDTVFLKFMQHMVEEAELGTARINVGIGYNITEAS